jgi:branched-chain amino acid transport system substrate-binding protein
LPGTPTYITTATPDIANGTIFASAYISNDATDQTKAFAAAYQAKWNEAPEAHGAKAYDGAMMVFQAMKSITSTISGETLSIAMHAIKNYQGLQGVCTFDAAGEGFHGTEIGIVVNGKDTVAP